MKQYPYTVDISVNGLDWTYEAIIDKEHTGDYVIFRGIINVSQELQLTVSFYSSKKLWQKDASKMCNYAEKTILNKLREALQKWLAQDET